jgi:predicted DNA-binding ribbon-helix-helix protein
VHISGVAKTKRVQVLMEPEEFDILEELARKRKSSVADLMREAARAHLLGDVERARRATAAQNFLGLPEAPLPSWKDLKKEIEDRRG